ncbi:MAG: DUF1517 domain-containing protein [Kofleriaceae bacterium]
MKWLLVLALCASAAADTGGRVGGGSWKSGGSSSSPRIGGSSSSSTWSTPSSHPPSFPKSDTSSFGGGTHWSTPTSSPSTPSTPSLSSSSSSSTPGDYVPSTYVDTYTPPQESWFWRYGFWIFFFGIAASVAFGFLREFLGIEMPSFRPRFDGPVPQEEIDVSVLRVGIDGRARVFVQRELARIGKTANTSTDEGRVALLREVALMLRRLRDAWIYGGAVNEAMGAMDYEKSVFDHHVDDARVRFREETVSNVQGVQGGAAPGAYTPRTEEGAGVILVSIILAARRELFTVTKIGNGSDLAAALEAAGTLDAGTLVAVEIVWQPSEDADRMSSLELEAKYPQPELFPLFGALAGKTFCLFCDGPFPAELVSCPHCGAPAQGREAA